MQMKLVGLGLSPETRLDQLANIVDLGTTTNNERHAQGPL